jgi:hypothetical protein
MFHPNLPKELSVETEDGVPDYGQFHWANANRNGEPVY